jgi:hypothetical protein
MNETAKSQTLLASKSGDAATSQIVTSADEGYKLCTPFDARLRTALADIEAGLRVPTLSVRFPRPLTDSERQKLEQAREALISGLESSRFLRGKLLFEYRAAFLQSSVWKKALAAIAYSEGCHANTIRNLIHDYEFAKRLPETVRSALTDQGVDPARMRNRVVVEIVADRLQSEPKEPSPEQARQIVAQVVAQKVKRVKVKPDPYVKPDLDETLNYDEERIHHIRKAVREAVEYVPTFKRLEILKEAIEQEMYAVWGERLWTVIVLYPHSSAISLDGRKIKSDDREEGVA